MLDEELLLLSLLLLSSVVLFVLSEGDVEEPVETVIVTVEPFLARLPDPGLELITSPEETELLEAYATLTEKPAFSRAELAELSLLPTTSGTLTFDEPLETVIVTVEPFSAEPVGDCFIT